MSIVAELARIAAALERVADALSRPRAITSVRWKVGIPVPEGAKHA